MDYAVKKFGVIVAFASLALLLLANAYVTRHQVAIQIGRQQWLSHTRQAQFEIQETDTLLADAETGQRGFLYTGDPRYLEPYTLATTQLDSQLQEFAKLSADNPSQLANVATLRKLSQEKLYGLSTTIALYRAGKVEEARALVLSGHGRSIMEDIRKVIAQMQQEEVRLEDARSAAYERSVQRTFTAIDLATAVAILGLGIVAHFILRERRVRERHARQLRAREEWFRVTLHSIGNGVIATDGQGTVNFLNPSQHRSPASHSKTRSTRRSTKSSSSSTNTPARPPRIPSNASWPQALSSASPTTLFSNTPTDISPQLKTAPRASVTIAAKS